jgi:Tfp pilus assembly PilM family ATPase
VSVLRDEVLRHLLYWKEHSAHIAEKGKKQSGAVDRVVLCGGNANIAGIAEYMSASLKMPVTRGDAWQNVTFENGYVPAISERESVEYGTAIGLALRACKL